MPRINVAAPSRGDRPRTGGTFATRLRWLAAGAPVLLVALWLAVSSSAAASPAAGSAATGSAAAGPAAMVRIAAAPQAPRGAKAAGTVSSSAPVIGMVVLKPRDDAALQKFIREVTDKGSPRFGQYLPARAFASRFGPLPVVIDAVRSQLQADGLRVSGVSSDGLLVRFRGSAGRVQKAFHTTLESFRLADGTLGQGATSAIAVPATIAPSVAAVIGLDNLVRLQPSGEADPGTTPGNIVLTPRKLSPGRRKFAAAHPGAIAHPAGSPSPCPRATSAALRQGGLTDDQIAHAYGAFGLYGAGDLGAGQRIGIYELEPFLRSDVKTFDTCYFGAAAAASMIKRLNVIPVDGGQPTGRGSGEASLDVQDVSALAPGATIDVYEGPSPGANPSVYDALDVYAAIINSDRDRIVSSSWGLCERAVQLGQPGLQQAENELFQQAAAQGQTIFAATGDQGSADCNTFQSPAPPAGQNPISADDPASQPYVVGVGGTTIDDAATQPPLEHAWNDGVNGGAGGGGISLSWTMPAWQQAARVPGIARPQSADYTIAARVQRSFGYPPSFCQSTGAGTRTATPCRLLPDVSAQADPFTGAVTVYSASSRGDGWSTTGGTSSAAPIWAAMLALANASPTCAARPTTARGVGFVSPLLYAVASNPDAYAASFHDVRSGNNDVYGLANGSVFPARTGYDLASGLGSPQLTGPGGTAGLAFYLCSLADRGSRPIVTRLSPASGSTIGGVRVQITGSGFMSRGRPDVAGIQIGSRRLAPRRFRVRSATSITATLPPARQALPPGAPAPQDGAGPADLVVILGGGESSAPGPGSTFQYVDRRAAGPIPSVNGLVPYGGLRSARARVTILGSGFTEARKVTFGGVNATDLRVLSPFRITVIAPAYSRRTACSPLPSSGVFRGENAANDICQVSVTVVGAHGASASAHILPPPEGAFATNSMGVQVLAHGCHCERVPAPSEFDYLPMPKVTSVSTSAGPGSLASETGGTVITVHGQGFDPLTIDWTDFGSPTRAASQDTNYAFLSGTELQIVAPSRPVTAGRASVPFSVRTLAGQSRPRAVTYAGIPRVTAVVNSSNRIQLDGIYGGPDTGGTPIRISGQGFAGQLAAPLEFVDSRTSALSAGTQYSFRVHSNTSLSTRTVAQNPGLVHVELCTVTGCSRSPSADLFYLYPPGDPKVDSISPSSGPTAGATSIEISGENLGCPLAVFFGNTLAKSFQAARALLDCGSTQALSATSPPGTVGAKLPVSIATVESYFTGSGRSASTASFAYSG